MHVALDDTRQSGPVSGIESYRMGPPAEDHREVEELGRDDVHVRVASNLERQWQGPRSVREVGCYRDDLLGPVSRWNELVPEEIC